MFPPDFTSVVVKFRFQLVSTQFYLNQEKTGPKTCCSSNVILTSRQKFPLTKRTTFISRNFSRFDQNEELNEVEEAAAQTSFSKLPCHSARPKTFNHLQLRKLFGQIQVSTCFHPILPQLWSNSGFNLSPPNFTSIKKKQVPKLVVQAMSY